LNGNTLSVDGSQVGVFEKRDKVGLTGFLKGKDGRGLETKIRLEVLGDLTNETLEGQLPDQKIGVLLVLADLTESDGTRPEPVGLLDTTGSGGSVRGLAGGLGGELLTRGLASGGFAGGLLSSGH